MDKKVSVVICTHNPREDYLTRVLSALRSQTLPEDDWELLLIDNASAKPLAESWDLSWHPHARHVREESLGLTPARLRGIRESVGELVIFVDDDNVLDSEYLYNASAIFAEKPSIGAFGASVTAEFERQPPPDILKYVSYLAVEEITQDFWGNFLDFSKAVPFGAGLCVQRAVAQLYLKRVNAGTLEKSLGRVGDGLGGHEDTDLAFSALDVGMGTGRFHKLKLTHLIPSSRLTHDYIIRLAAGGARTMIILMWLRNMPLPGSRPLEFLKFSLHLLRCGAFERRVLLAARRARRQVMQELGIA